MISRALIVRPGALGDSILTLPVLHALRLAGISETTVLGTSANWRFLNPVAPGLTIRDFASSEFLGFFNSALKDYKLDQWLSQFELAVVYLAGDVSALKQILSRAGIKTVIYASPPVTDSAGGAHASRQLLKPLESVLGAKACGEALQILDAANDSYLGQIENPGLTIKPGFVAIHPGSGGLKKCWPAGHYAGLAAELERRGERIVAVFGPADDKVKKEFFSALGEGLGLRSVENLPLRELMAILTSARIYIGNDSGASHLAARLCPVLSIFGHTDPLVWAPLGRAVEVVQAPFGNLAHLSVAEVLDRLTGRYGSMP